MIIPFFVIIFSLDMLLDCSKLLRLSHLTILNYIVDIYFFVKFVELTWTLDCYLVDKPYVDLIVICLL